MLEKNWHVSAAELLDTLDLYFELKSCRKVGDKLGVGIYAVSYRLALLGVVLKPPGDTKISPEQVNDMKYIDALKLKLRKKAEWERHHPFASRTSASRAVPSVELLTTVALYFQLNSLAKVSEYMGLDYKAVYKRLKGLDICMVPMGRKGLARDYNDMKKVEKIMKRLQDEARIEIYLAQ